MNSHQLTNSNVSKISLLVSFLILLCFIASCGDTALPGSGNSSPDDSSASHTSGNPPGDDISTGVSDGSLSGPDFNISLDPGFGFGTGNNGGFAEIAPPIAILPLMFDNDMGISIDDTWYPILQDAAALIAALGDDYQLSTAPSCVFTGEDKEFSFSNASVFTNPDGQIDIWYLIELKDNTLQTSRRVKVGDSFDDIISVYGDNYFWEGSNILYYNLSGIEGDIESPCILFTLSNNTITMIEIYYPTNDFEN